MSWQIFCYDPEFLVSKNIFIKMMDKVAFKLLLFNFGKLPYTTVWLTEIVTIRVNFPLIVFPRSKVIIIVNLFLIVF